MSSKDSIQPCPQGQNVPGVEQTIELSAVELGRIAPWTKDNGDPFLVAFEHPWDKDNPRCWSNGKKWTVTDVLAATGFNRIMVSTIMAPALTTIQRELHMSTTESVMALSGYMLATAFGPFVMAPLSEMYGRAPILHVSNVWFLVWNIVCGFANTKEVLIASRFLAGFGASAIYALANGVLGDVWSAEQRGRSLSIYLLIPLLGAAVGPIIGGVIAARTSWRWMFWSTSAFQAVMILLSFMAFHETYAPLILRRRAKELRATTGEQQYYTLSERTDAGRSIGAVLRKSLSRPFRLLAFHPIIQIVALQSGFYYGTLYIMLSTFSDMWIKLYGESIEISSLHYIGLALGEIIGSQVGGELMDVIFRRLRTRANGEGVPEHHLPLAFPGAALAAAGFLMYGWCAHFRVFWFAVDVGATMAAFGMQISGMAIQAYMIDAYAEHTSSASAAAQFVRSLTAFAFPLFSPSMYNAIGYGWGNTLVAALTLVIGGVVPLFVWRFGARLRSNARPSY